MFQLYVFPNRKSVVKNNFFKYHIKLCSKLKWFTPFKNSTIYQFIFYVIPKVLILCFIKVFSAIWIL